MQTEDPPLAKAVVHGAKPRPRWPLYIAGIGLACTLAPFHCSVDVGSVHHEWNKGGPLFGGVVAILFASYTLLRRRGALGPRGKTALVMVALGVAAAIYGYLTIERVGGSIDASARTEQLRAALADDKGVDALLADADPELRSQAAQIHRIFGALRRRFGHLAAKQEWSSATDAQGLTRFDTTATLEHGTLNLRLVYRGDHLAGLHLDVPAAERPPVADASQAAVTLAADLAAGAIDRFHDEVDPMMAIKPEFEDLIRQVHDHAGDSPQIEIVDQHACGDGQQCFELHITGATLDQKLELTLASTYGLWLATDVTFVKE